MAAVAVQIRGTLYDLTKRTSQQVLLQGEASLLGLEIGGGPIIPPGGSGDAHPEHPIYYPPGIWGPTDPRPSPPIANVPGLPPMPDQPPDVPPDAPPGTVVKPPPAQGGWSYVTPYGWGFFPMGGAGPKG